MSSFDPASFLSSSITEANDTVVIPVPAGEFQGIVEKVSARQTPSRDNTQVFTVLDIIWIIEDAQVKAELNRDTVTCKQGIMLDVDPATGRLDTSKGKNIGLGRLRDAVGLNVPGQPFSFDMLAGRAAKVLVKHRIDGENTYAEVKGVARF